MLEAPAASRVVLLLIDGFGYVRARESEAAGLTPNLTSLGEPLLGLTVYPPATRVATAALLSGAPPDVTASASEMYGKRSWNTVDVASTGGLQVVAVEGESLTFNLRSADVRLFGRPRRQWQHR